MIAQVVRIFEDPDVIHVHGTVDPLSDIEVINLELILADQETVGKRLQNIGRDAKRGDKMAAKEAEVLDRLRQHIEQGNLACTLDLTDDEKAIVKQLHLLTMKPFLYIFNKKNCAQNLDELNDERWQELKDFIERTESEYVMVDAGIENDLKDLSEDEKLEFRREYATPDSGIDTLIRGAYHCLGLMSFFTTGEKETRAWTVPHGSSAPRAGAAIHTDFEQRFIRAQVVSFEDLVRAGSIAKAREEGKLRTEGKEYIVKDGDVIEFMVG
jgi:hypothetical protein